MATSFSSELRQEAASIWGDIMEHPFLLELQRGTLPVESFRYYVIQDYHYMEGFGRVVSIALSKAPDTEAIRQLARRVTTPVERPLHSRMFELLGVTEEEAEAAAQSPTNLAYVNHMLTAASMGGVGEAAAAILPCPWSYHEIGQQLQPSPHPVYGHWVDAYSSGILEESTAAWRELVDRFGAEGGPAVRAAMRDAFLASSRYEHMFWSMAYSREQWPVSL